MLATEEYRLKLFPPNTLLIPKSGASTFLNHRALLGLNSYVSSHLATVIAGDKLLPKYLYYWSLTIDAKHLTHDVNYPSLKLSEIEEAKIPLPPIETQNKIVSILEKAEATKQFRTQADELTNQLLQSVFLEMFGDPCKNPKKWKVEKLEKYISFITSGSRGWAKYYSATGAKFIRVQNLTGHQLNYQDMAFVSPPDTTEAKRTKIKQNDLLLSITGVVGLVTIAPENIGDAYVSQHVAIIRLREGINPQYLAHFLSCPAGGQQQIMKRQYGQTKPGLGLGDIKAINIFVPPITLQEKFVQIIETIKAIKEKQQNAQNETQNLYNNLMQKAFLGELMA